MKAASVKELKQELTHYNQEDLVKICLRLSKFKKENKELLTYLLFEEQNESDYVKQVKTEADELFEGMNTSSYFYIKKTVRKVLRTIKKYARYSDQKSTEAELLLYFCTKLKYMSPSMNRSTILVNLYNRQLIAAKKIVNKLHEDIQFDFENTIEALEIS